MSTSAPALDPTQLSWLQTPAAGRVFDCLEGAGYEARAVGGAVRNALLHTPVNDIDIATTATPQTVMELAQSAGLAAHPTGLGHGTVTLVADHQPFEVTTLRRDVETHGRSAVVAFTTDWTEDARRRDFTINALYCNRDGTIFDPLNALPDIFARRVRFIGAAKDRIREDYLRILRFFRFSAIYSGGTMDETGLAACLELRDGLEKLSAERVNSELHKLLTAPHALEVLRQMADHNFLSQLLAGDADIDRFSKLVAIEKANGLPASDAGLRLAALAVHNQTDPKRLTSRLRLSNAESRRLSATLRTAGHIEQTMSEREEKIALYKQGEQTFRDRILLSWSETSADDVNDPRWQNLLTLAERWQPPKLPVGGEDLIKAGIEPGPEMKRILQQFESWWCEADFPTDQRAIHAKLQSLITSASDH